MAKRPIYLLVFLVAFLDLVGFSIIFPLFPELLKHYLSREGPESLIGGLMAQLEVFSAGRENAAFLVTVLFGGVLGSVYSFLQFLFAPVWGALSDRVGRRPTILVTLAGTALSYVGWAFAGEFWVLVLARLVGGAMAGNVSTVSAVIADVTTPEERSKGMGLVGAAIGLGFIAGPAIGGAASLLTFHAPSGDGAFALNPFSFPALLALALALLNLALAALKFPETHPPERRGAATSTRSANPLALFRGVSAPGVQRTNLINFSFLIAFSAMEFTLSFLALERFAFTPKHNAGMFVFVGLVIALVQGGALRRLAPRLGDRRLASIGLAILVPAFVIVGAARSPAILFVGLFGMAVGSALATPTLSALVSRYAPTEQQGLALGLFRSLGALSRALGPLAGGLLFWRYGSVSPYWVGAAVVLIPLALALRLPEPPATSRSA